MKELDFEQMECVQGGLSASDKCAIGTMSAVVIGTIGLIAASGGTALLIAIAIGSQYASLATAMIAC